MWPMILPMKREHKGHVCLFRAWPLKSFVRPSAHIHSHSFSLPLPYPCLSISSPSLSPSVSLPHPQSWSKELQYDKGKSWHVPGCLNHHTEGNYSGGLNGHIDLPDTGVKSKFVLYKATETGSSVTDCLSLESWLYSFLICFLSSSSRMINYFLDGFIWTK